MKFVNRHRTWGYIFASAVALVIVYKFIDHVDVVAEWIGNIVKALNPFIIGFVIAYLLNQPCNTVARLCRKSKVKFLEKRADGVGVLAVYLIILVLFVLVMRIVLPALYRNVIDLANNLPGYSDRAIEFIDNLQGRMGFTLINTDSFSMSKAIKGFIKEVDLSQLGKYAEGVLSTISGVINVFIALIVSIYMCIDKKRVAAACRRVTKILFIKKRSESIFEYIGKINDIFSKYIYCKVIEALIITIITTLVLSILGVRYALILGLITGIFNFIPYFGSIISATITVIITIFSSGILPAVWTGIALLILEQIDGNFIGPKIIGDKLDMRPLWVIFSVTVGGSLFGFLGLLLSVPVMIVIKMIVSDLLKTKETQLVESTVVNKEEKGRE